MTSIYALGAAFSAAARPTPLALLLVVAGAVFGEPPWAPAGAATAAEPPQPATKVDVSLSAQGTLFAEASPERSPVSQPIELEARFSFTESKSPAGGTHPPVTRRYHTATADFTIDGQRRRTALAADAAEILVALQGTTPTPYLAESFLAREEADLLDLPFDATLVDGLRPPAAVAENATWRIAPDLTAGLLSIDTVESGGIDARLVAVSEGTAEVALEGTVTGAVDGAATRIELTGSYHCPAAAEGDSWILTEPITDLASEISERREAGWVAPGLDVTATLTLTRSAGPQNSDGSDKPTDALGPVAAERPDGPGRPGTVWERHRQGRYSLVLDNRWKVVEDTAAGLVMRLMDRGALVAQCSILPLPRTAADSPPALETVRRDVERSLGDQFGQITAAEATTRGDGTRVVRVVAEGTAEDRPFRWIHHVLTDPTGHRAAVTCMHEPAMADRFGIADRELVAGLALVADGPVDPLRQARKPAPPAEAATE